METEHRMSLTFTEHSSPLCVHFTHFIHPTLHCITTVTKYGTQCCSNWAISIFHTCDISGTTATYSVFQTQVENLLVYICSPRWYTKCFNEWVLFSTYVYVGSTCFGPHRSIIRSVLYKLYLQIWYVVLLCILLDTSSRYGWTCRVIRVLPHTKVCEYSLYKTLLMMDRWCPKHVEPTYT